MIRTPCERVARFDDHLVRLVTDLLDTVRLPVTAGLAASQMGSDLAVFAHNVDGRIGYLVNPEIIELDGEQDGPEGCLSVPGITASRRRAAYAAVTGVDLRRRPVTLVGSGELARCLQHETDHLHGELYIDRLPGPLRERVLREMARPLPHPASPVTEPGRL